MEARPKGKNPKDIQMLKAQNLEPTLNRRGELKALVDPLKLTPLSIIGLGSKNQGYMMPLRKYKFNQI